MTLTTAALCLLLGLTGPDDEKDEPTALTLTPARAPPIAAASDAVNFDALPEPPHTSDDARIKRFLGAFTGGVVGLGAALALMPLGDQGCFGSVGCVSGAQGFLGVLAPLLSVTGAWLGFTLLGGDGGLITPVAALLPASLLALLLLNIARDVQADSTLALMPYLIASGVFLAGGAALALDLRARQLDRLGNARSFGQAPAGRVAVVSLVGGLTAASSAFLTVLVGTQCRDAACVGLTVGLGGALSVAVAASTWGVHRAMGGRGSFLSALAGFGLGGLATLGAVGLYMGSQNSFTGFAALRNNAGSILLVELGVASALFLPVVALEWSHADAVEASMPSFSFSGAPTPNGGMVAASMRF